MADWRVWGVPFDPPRGVAREDQERRDEVEFLGGGSPEQMALEWARAFDFGTTEYYIVKGEDYLVTVANLHSGQQWQYRVSGESRPVYSAAEYAGKNDA